MNNRNSLLQKLTELIFFGKFGDKLDQYFMERTKKYFDRKYNKVDNSERKHMFKSERNVSKTHPLNMQKYILNEYLKKLSEYKINQYLDSVNSTVNNN